MVRRLTSLAAQRHEPGRRRHCLHGTTHPTNPENEEDPDKFGNHWSRGRKRGEEEEEKKKKEEEEEEKKAEKEEEEEEEKDKNG
ncbi:hypothetical protein E2C01_018064 [Portunus trituberculatus]|uniref:Uncharacterized protein n=1 Tax=Portunus trituberculatus TaxID=210409 RepID=A0A5B7DV74_PORTR|nr:hypothetical protein [Portunus trituberculatus]